MAIDFNADFSDRSKDNLINQSPELSLLGQSMPASSIAGGAKFSAGMDGSSDNRARQSDPVSEAQKTGKIYDGNADPIILAQAGVRQNCGGRACYGPDPEIGRRLNNADQDLRKGVDKRREKDVREQEKYDKYYEEQRLARERAKANRPNRSGDPRCDMKWDKLPAGCPAPQKESGDILDQEPPPPRRTGG